MNKFSQPYFTLAVLFACLAVFIFLGAVVRAWNDPTNTPPNGGGAITTDASSNLFFRTGSPLVNRLKINSAGLIDALANKITNLATPTGNSDAATKAYVDGAIIAGASTAKVWGQGRPGVVVVNSGGECTTLAGIKISRGSHSTLWTNAATACPAGWWVCSLAERGADSCPGAGTTHVWVSDSNGGTNGLYVQINGVSGGDNLNIVNNNTWCCSL